MTEIAAKFVKCHCDTDKRSIPWDDCDDIPDIKCTSEFEEIEEFCEVSANRSRVFTAILFQIDSNCAFCESIESELLLYGAKSQSLNLLLHLTDDWRLIADD